MGRCHLRRPSALIQPVAVLGESRQVDDAEVGTAGGEGNVADGLAPGGHHLAVGLLLFLRVEVGEHRRVHIERRGFSQVVVAGPDKLSGAFGHLVFEAPLIVRAGGPGRGVQVIGTHLERRVHIPALALFLLYRETVIAARRDAGGGFAAQHGLAGVLLYELPIQVRLVVEAVYVQGGGVIREGGAGVVIAGGG